MIATDSQMSSTRSSWWLENSTVTPARARSARIAVMSSTPPGSRPANGSASTSRSGSCISAGASQLPPLLVAVGQRLELGRFPARQAEPPDPVPRGGAGRGRRHVVQAAQVLQLLHDLHARVEAAFL